MLSRFLPPAPSRFFVQCIKVGHLLAFNPGHHVTNNLVSLDSKHSAPRKEHQQSSIINHGVTTHMM
jgi:hypothetical protein